MCLSEMKGKKMDAYNEYKRIRSLVINEIKDEICKHLSEKGYVEGISVLRQAIGIEESFLVYRALKELEEEGKVNTEKKVGKWGRTLIYPAGKRPGVPTLEEVQAVRKEFKNNLEELKVQFCEYLKDKKGYSGGCQSEIMKKLGVTNKWLFHRTLRELEEDGIIRREKRGLRTYPILKEKL